MIMILVANVNVIQLGTRTTLVPGGNGLHKKLLLENENAAVFVLGAETG